MRRHDLSSCRGGYDLFKLFRTAERDAAAPPAERDAVLRAFLQRYLACCDEVRRDTAAAAPRGDDGADRHGGDAAAARLDALVAETRVFEPLTWLEAAVFFAFAICDAPSAANKLDELAPLARQRWGRYLATRHLLLDVADAMTVGG